MNWLESLRGIFASVLQDNLRAPGVFRQEFRHVISLAMKNDPTRAFIIVLRNVLSSEHLFLLRLVRLFAYNSTAGAVVEVVRRWSGVKQGKAGGKRKKGRMALNYI